MVGGQGNTCSLITSKVHETMAIDKIIFSKGLFFTDVESDGNGRCDLLQWPVSIEIDVDVAGSTVVKELYWVNVEEVNIIFSIARE